MNRMVTIAAPSHCILRLLYILLLVNAYSTVTQACSCDPSVTFYDLFDSAQYVDTVYILGQAKIGSNGTFDGWVTSTYRNPTNPDGSYNLYYLAYQKHSHKGCRGRQGQVVYYKTTGRPEGIDFDPNCLVRLTPGWYLLGSARDVISNVQTRYKRVEFCSLIKSTERNYSRKERGYVWNNTKKCVTWS